MEVGSFCEVILVLFFLPVLWVGFMVFGRPSHAATPTENLREAKFQARVPGQTLHGPFRFCKKGCD